jgi:DNA excision repair protein ERCC-8
VQGSRDATVRLWDVRRSGGAACLMTLDQHRDHSGLVGGRAPAQRRPTELAKAHDGWVVSVAYTPDGRWLLSAGEAVQGGGGLRDALPDGPVP